MEKEKGRISCNQAKEIDIVNYLDSIGIKPAQIKGANYWYHSPLRKENTPSFKVNRKLNRFYDFGEGWGGNLIDFGTRFYNCSISDFLKRVTNDFSLHRPIYIQHQKLKEQPLKISILSSTPISNTILIRYLASRKIPLNIATQYAEEIHYLIGRKEYYGIGFKNDIGGYEIRNPYFKGSSTPKAITTIKNDHKAIAVFEGFLDFLSFLILFENKPALQSDFLILNSLSFFEKSSALMETYESVDLYLDNNTAGQNCISKALLKNKCYQDKSILYKNHEDLNDWLRGIFISSKESDPSLKEPP